MTLQEGEFPLAPLLFWALPTPESEKNASCPQSRPTDSASGAGTICIYLLSLGGCLWGRIHGLCWGPPAAAAAGGGTVPDPWKRRGAGDPRPFLAPVEVRLPLLQRDAAGALPGEVLLRPAGVCPLRQRRREVRGRHPVGAELGRLLEQPPGLPAGLKDRRGLLLPRGLQGGQLRGRKDTACDWPENQAHRHRLPHQDRPRFPQHHPPLHRDGLLPPGDRRPVAEERAAGEGGRRLRGGAPERRLDLPAPGAAGDPAPAWGRLRLQGGARQPGGPRHRRVGATFLQRCQEQALDGGRGGRAGGGLPGRGALPLPEGEESNSHPATSPHELILLSLPALRCKIAEAFQHLMNFCLFCNTPRMQLQHWPEEENRSLDLLLPRPTSFLSGPLCLLREGETGRGWRASSLPPGSPGLPVAADPPIPPAQHRPPFRAMAATHPPPTT